MRQHSGQSNNVFFLLIVSIIRGPLLGSTQFVVLQNADRLTRGLSPNEPIVNLNQVFDGKKAYPFAGFRHDQTLASASNAFS